MVQSSPLLYLQALKSLNCNSKLSGFRVLDFFSLLYPAIQFHYEAAHKDRLAERLEIVSVP